MRPQALLFAALFLLSPLAGCLGGSTATANELTPRARAIARSWSPDAGLEAVVGVEMKELPAAARAALEQAGSESPEAQLLQYTDANVGDGRAGAWLFAFRSGDRQLVLALDAGGRELLRHEDDTSSAEPLLGDVAIDSDRAMALAAAGNSSFAQARGGAVAATLMLVPAAAGPVWVLVLAGSFEGDGGDAAFAMVDATSGNVTASDDIDAFLDGAGSGGSAQAASRPSSPFYHPAANRTFVRTETGSHQGTLTLATPDQSTPFEVEEAGHGRVRLQLDLPRSLPPSQATAVVTGPDGRTATLTFTASATGSSPATADLDAPAPGTYQVAIHLDAGVLQQYAFQWCAPGSRMTAQDPASACGA
ncbi:MAG TPA: hypothetical protein VM241_05190 [Candidatus Thermoplasmatota archaeon]|nr:hypothetical protein [Candidatus Thermoplasmatota archaeon]